MKSFIPSIIALAGLCFLAEPNSPKNLDSSPLAAVNPLCDCAPCKCVDCDCPASREESPAVVVVADEKPSITPAEAQQVAVVTEQKFTQPAPVKPVAKPTPKPVVKAAAGHWQNVQSCGPRGCSVSRVWVPAGKPMPAAKSQAPVYYAPVQSGSCGPGGCGRVGLFGRRR